ncbi:hypothetical protein PUR49_06405 [Streptomyces sp. BE147]|uniref:hypothetical protein n=1 Tax=Streptomyces sp. BE147 TaxID=3002524 RepID=UPI002E7A9485|nr:hypothetical protein [Streptomyces sp. BE147]MEE1736143.1 hypothetical protein [Streptomyces sp. BE147]
MSRIASRPAVCPSEFPSSVSSDRIVSKLVICSPWRGIEVVIVLSITEAVQQDDSGLPEPPSLTTPTLVHPHP